MYIKYTFARDKREKEISTWNQTAETRLASKEYRDYVVLVVAAQ